jgi:ring-1,2-phenylacetyl-CoA epoxidase subunit PaaD
LSPITKHTIYSYLKEVFDPEVPVLSIVDLGIVRDVKIDGEHIEVVITPTYTGCPAMKVIEDDITSKLNSKGINDLHITTVLSPAWTTDWLTEEGKTKLREFGIAPPEGMADKNVLFGEPKKVHCPHCGSLNTVMKSQFGSTACKALYFCNDCLEPFDYFKCI